LYWKDIQIMRILLLIITLPATLLHAVRPARAHSPRQKASRFYPHGYMREEVDALRQAKPRK
jgi:hypothetical protein